MRVLFAMAFCGVAACSNPPSPDGGGPVDSGNPSDMGMADTNTPDNGGVIDAGQDVGSQEAAVMCNSLTTGTAVTVACQQTTAPGTGTGGSIVTGTYDATAVTIYLGPVAPDGGLTCSEYLAIAMNPTAAISFDFNGSVAQLASTVPGSATTSTTSSYATSGNMIMVSTPTCPPGSTAPEQTYTYTATSTTITLYLASSTATIVIALTHR